MVIKGNPNQNYNIISPLLEWLKDGKKKKRVGKDMEKRELLCTVGGNVNWYSYYRKQYGGSSEN